MYECKFTFAIARKQDAHLHYGIGQEGSITLAKSMAKTITKAMTRAFFCQVISSVTNYDKDYCNVVVSFQVTIQVQVNDEPDRQVLADILKNASIAVDTNSILRSSLAVEFREGGDNLRPAKKISGSNENDYFGNPISTTIRYMTDVVEDMRADLPVEDIQRGLVNLESFRRANERNRRAAASEKPANTFSIVLENSLTQRITIAVDPYKPGTVSVIFNQDHAANIFSMLSASDLMSGDLPCQMFKNIFICSDAGYAEKIVNVLTGLSLITPEDRARVAPVLRAALDIIEVRNQSASGVNQSQAESLEFIAENYIDHILEATNNPEQTLKLLATAFSPGEIEAGGELEYFLSDEGLDVTLFTSVEALWKICHGRANLESTFIRLDGNLPNLWEQRFKIKDTCVARLKEKYAGLTEKEQFYLYFSLWLFVRQGQTFPPLSDTTELIDRFLLDELTTEDMLFFKNLDSRVMVSATFREMGIGNGDDTNLDRVAELREQCDSRHFQVYVEQLIRAQAASSVRKADTFYNALRNAEVDVVKAELEQGADVHQGFTQYSDPRTPIFIAVESQNPELVRAVLAYGPDVDLHHKTGMGSPLHRSIQNQDPVVTKLLLGAGANALRYCLFVRQSASEMVGLTPIGWAMHIFKESGESDAAREVIRCLISAGAAIGMVWNAPSPVSLNNQVMLGCTYSGDENPILTADEFIHWVHPYQFDYWLKTFSRMLPLFSNLSPQSPVNVELHKAILLIQEHKERFTSWHVPSAIQSQSPIHSAGDAHTQLVRELAPLFAEDVDFFEPVSSAVDEREYAKALRRACTADSSKLRRFAEILLKYKERLSIPINEQAGSKRRAAIHHAGRKGSREMFQLLLAHGADPSLVDAEGKTASSYIGSRFSLGA